MRLIYFFSICLITSNIYSLTIHRDINMMNEMLSDIDYILANGQSPQSTLIVFDIDHTLIDILPGKKLKAFELTEKIVPLMIRKLQNRQFSVITLTARPNILRRVTKHQLNYYSMDFNRSKIGFNWAKSRKINGFQRSVSYKDGIMMASNQHKGRLLEYLIRSQYKGEIPFDQIIFVDDLVKNTAGVYEVFTELGIEVATYRYMGRKKRQTY